MAIRASRLPDLIAQFGKLGPGGAIESGIEGFATGITLRDKALAAIQKAEAIKEEKRKAQESVKRSEDIARRADIAEQLASKNITPTGSQVGQPAGTVLRGPGEGVEGPAQQVPIGTPRPELLSEDPQLQQELEAEKLGIEQGLFPEEFVKADLKASKETKGPLEPGSKGFQQGGLTITGPDGLPKTVAVSFDVASGRYMNPVTGEPVEEAEDIQSLLPKGFKLTSKLIGRTADNQPITFESTTNTQMVNGQKYTPEQHGVIFPLLKNAPASFAEAMANFSTSKEILQRITESFEPAFTGPISGRYKTVTEYIGSNEPDVARFMGLVRTYQNAMIKAITGAQMGEPEAKRLLGQMPTFKDNPKAFIEKLRNAAELADISMATRLQSAEASGYAVNQKALNLDSATDLVENAFNLGKPANKREAEKEFGGKDPSKMTDEELQAEIDSLN